MSTRGRKAELKVIEGGAGVERDGQDVHDVPAHIPSAMHAEWLAVMDDLRSRRMLTEAMLGTVEAYVMAQWNMRKAQEALDEHGVLIKDSKGGLLKNPAGTLHGKAQATVMRLAAEMGLTPAARSRPKMKEPSEDDKQKDFFDGSSLLDF